MIDWTTIILSCIGTGGLVELGNMLYFRPKLKEAKAEAKMKELEAEDKRHDYLEERIASMEKLYNEQGKRLDSVFNELLSVKEENIRIKSEMVELREENARLKKQISKFEKNTK